MATSGSKSVSVTSHDTLKFSWSLSSQSVANNTSTVSWKMQLISDAYGRISSSASKDWKVVVNGKTYSGTNTVGISASSTKTLASGSTTISHNSDGTKTFSYSFSQEFAITFSGSSITTKSGSGTGTLTTIPRASTVSATSANIGSTSTITISRKSSSFTHTLTYTFGSLSGTIVTKTSSTSVSWTLPTTFYAQVTTAKSKTGTITCSTYNGSTLVGTKTCSFTANVSSANAPSLSPNVYDSNTTTTALTGDSSKFIKYYSNAYISIGASVKNSATLKSQKCTCGAKSITTSTGTINAVESASFVFSATDSRGYTTSQTVTKTLINYVKLTCNLTTNNPTAEGNMTFTVNGNYFNGSFGSVVNTLTIQYRYKTNDGSYGNWITATATLSGNTYNANVNLSGLDYQSTYTLEARALDKLATINSATKTVKTTPIFDWGENDFKFNVPVTVKGTTYLQGISYLQSTTYMQGTTYFGSTTNYIDANGKSRLSYLSLGSPSENGGIAGVLNAQLNLGSSSHFINDKGNALLNRIQIGISGADNTSSVLYAQFNLGDSKDSEGYNYYINNNGTGRFNKLYTWGITINGSSQLNYQFDLGTTTASDGKKYYFNNNATGRFNALRYTSIAQISSARRYKENIDYKDIDYWHDGLMNVKPCTYTYINGEDKSKKMGVIAEDLEKCLPELVEYNDDGECETVYYMDFIIPLVAEVQRLNKIVNIQQEEITYLKELIQERG